MIFAMLRWWYTDGLVQAFTRIGGLTKQTLRTFSIPLLIGTLFAPWRRIVSPPGRGLDDKIRAALDNFVSRCVGFFVRLLVLIAAVVIATLVIVLSTVQAILWPLLPLVIVVGIILEFVR